MPLKVVRILCHGTVTIYYACKRWVKEHGTGLRHIMIGEKTFHSITDDKTYKVICHWKTDKLVLVQRHEYTGEKVSVLCHRTTGAKLYDSTKPRPKPWIWSTGRNCVSYIY